MKTLRLETTAPFQGLAELVAYDEGLFEKEGIQIEWMDLRRVWTKARRCTLRITRTPRAIQVTAA